MEGCASDFWVFWLRQAAGGERRPCEVHLRHAGGGFLEPCLHGHSGAQRLRQGEDGAGSDGAYYVTQLCKVC